MIFDGLPVDENSLMMYAAASRLETLPVCDM